MNTIRLTQCEIFRIVELVETIHQTGQFDYQTGNVVFVTVTQEDQGSGIGYELKASFQITHKDIDGNFVVTITDHRDW